MEIWGKIENESEYFMLSAETGFIFPFFLLGLRVHSGR